MNKMCVLLTTTWIYFCLAALSWGLAPSTYFHLQQPATQSYQKINKQSVPALQDTIILSAISDEQFFLKIFTEQTPHSLVHRMLDMYLAILEQESKELVTQFNSDVSPMEIDASRVHELMPNEHKSLRERLVSMIIVMLTRDVPLRSNVKKWIYSPSVVFLNYLKRIFNQLDFAEGEREIREQLNSNITIRNLLLQANGLQFGPDYMSKKSQIKAEIQRQGVRAMPALLAVIDDQENLSGVVAREIFNNLNLTNFNALLYVLDRAESESKMSWALFYINKKSPIEALGTLLKVIQYEKLSSDIRLELLNSIKLTINKNILSFELVALIKAEWPLIQYHFPLNLQVLAEIEELITKQEQNKRKRNGDAGEEREEKREEKRQRVFGDVGEVEVVEEAGQEAGVGAMDVVEEGAPQNFYVAVNPELRVNLEELKRHVLYEINFHYDETLAQFIWSNRDKSIVPEFQQNIDLALSDLNERVKLNEEFLSWLIGRSYTMSISETDRGPNGLGLNGEDNAFYVHGLTLQTPKVLSATMLMELFVRKHLNFSEGLVLSENEESLRTMVGYYKRFLSFFLQGDGIDLDLIAQFVNMEQQEFLMKTNARGDDIRLSELLRQVNRTSLDLGVLDGVISSYLINQEFA